MFIGDDEKNPAQLLLAKDHLRPIIYSFHKWVDHYQWQRGSSEQDAKEMLQDETLN